MLLEKREEEEGLAADKEEELTRNLRARIFGRINRIREERRILDEKRRAYQRRLINIYDDIYKDTKVRTEKDVNKLNDYFKDKLGQFDPITVRMNAVISDELRNKDLKASALIEQKLKKK